MLVLPLIAAAMQMRYAPGPAAAAMQTRYAPACVRPRMRTPLALEDDRESLDLLLETLEDLRDYVATDVAAAAMQAARERRSLDAFIAMLQDEVNELGDQIADDMDMMEVFLEDQQGALANDKRKALAARADRLVTELESAAPASFKARGADGAQPPAKSPNLPRNANVVVAGGSELASSEFGSLLLDGLERMGYNVSLGPETCSSSAADPTLPPSYPLRRALEGADALVLVCSVASEVGGVTPTYLAGASRVLPKSLRRVLVVAPRGVDRTLEPRFAWRNALGSLDRQRASEQAIVSAAEAVGAVATIMRVEVSGGDGGGVAGTRRGDGVTSPSDVVTRWGVVKPSRPGRPLSASPARRANPVLRSGQPRRNIVRIADGDTFVGEVDGQLVARAVREALRRSEAENKRFSLGAATLPTGASAFSWDDEFLKLNGPEVCLMAASPAAARLWCERRWPLLFDDHACGPHRPWAHGTGIDNSLGLAWLGLAWLGLAWLDLA